MIAAGPVWPEPGGLVSLPRQRRQAVAGAAAGLALLAGGCRQGPSPIPEPSPESTPAETPGAAERSAMGSSGIGRPSDPARDADAGVDAEAGLAVTTSINEAKKVEAKKAAQLRPDAGPLP